MPRKPSEVRCPCCNSRRVWKDGHYYYHGEEKQRYFCRECGRRFIDKMAAGSFLDANTLALSGYRCVSRGRPGDFDVFEPYQEHIRHGFKGEDGILRGWKSGEPTTDAENRRPGASQKSRARRETIPSGLKESGGPLRLQLEEKTEEQGASPELTELEIKGKIVEYLMYLKKQGLEEGSIKNYSHRIQKLVKLGADLLNPESVKKTIADYRNWGKGSKEQACYAYDQFLQMLGLNWEKPKYRQVHNIPFVPTEEQIDTLIHGCGRKLSAFLQFLKETGARRKEAWMTKWSDVDRERKTVRITPLKGSNARILPISGNLLGVLEMLPKEGKRIWPCVTPSGLNANFRDQRKRIAAKLNRPDLLEVTFHSIRHWKATTLYHQTKDILHVQRVLGHRNIQNTLQYIDIEHAIYQNSDSDQFHVKVAHDAEEAKNLLEAGFNYIGEIHSAQMFRKRR